MKHRFPLALAAGLLIPLACAAPVDRERVAARTEVVRGAADRGAAGHAPGPAPLPASAELDELLRLALRHDPGIQERFEAWRQALAEVRIAGGLPDAMVTFAHFVESVETRTGPQRNRLGASWALPWFDQLAAREDAAARAAEAAWWAVEARRAMVVRDVTVAWWDYAFLGRDLEVTRANLELLRQLEPVVQRRVQGGAPQADLVALQIEIARIGDAVAGLEAHRPALSARLDALLGRRAGPVWPWPAIVEPPLLAAADLDWRDALWERNPELQALRESLAAASARIDDARIQGRPDFTLGADWIDTGGARMPGVMGSGDDPVAVFVQMSVPFDRGRYGAMVDAAEHARAAAARRLDARQVDLHALAMTVLWKLDDSARRVALFRDTLLPRARQALTLTATAYAEGQVPMSDWIERQRAVLTFEAGYWRACAEHAKARAEFDALLGAVPDPRPGDAGPGGSG